MCSEMFFPSSTVRALLLDVGDDVTGMSGEEEVIRITTERL